MRSNVQDGRSQSTLSGNGLQFAKHAGVPAVQSIEIADGQYTGRKTGVIYAANYSHQGRTLRWKTRDCSGKGLICQVLLACMI